MTTIYQQNGHADRNAYLRSLASEMGIPLSTVRMAASVLGENEDFDGLVTELEDWADELGDE
jgi:hypothetical protein